MAIEKLNMNWKNKGETGAIPINATNLNKMTNKTDELVTGVNELQNPSEWITLSTDYQCSYRKVGKVVELDFIAKTKTLEFGKTYQIGVINEGFRPSKRIRTFVFNRSTSKAAPRNIYMEIIPAGAVILFNWDATDTFESLASSITYTVD